MGQQLDWTGHAIDLAAPSIWPIADKVDTILLFLHEIQEGKTFSARRIQSGVMLIRWVARDARLLAPFLQPLHQ